MKPRSPQPRRLEGAGSHATLTVAMETSPIRRPFSQSFSCPRLAVSMPIHSTKRRHGLLLRAMCIACPNPLLCALRSLVQPGGGVVSMS